MPSIPYLKTEWFTWTPKAVLTISVSNSLGEKYLRVTIQDGGNYGWTFDDGSTQKVLTVNNVHDLLSLSFVPSTEPTESGVDTVSLKFEYANDSDVTDVFYSEDFSLDIACFIRDENGWKGSVVVDYFDFAKIYDSGIKNRVANITLLKSANENFIMKIYSDSYVNVVVSADGGVDNNGFVEIDSSSTKTNISFLTKDFLPLTDYYIVGVLTVEANTGAVFMGYDYTDKNLNLTLEDVFDKLYFDRDEDGSLHSKVFAVYLDKRGMYYVIGLNSAKIKLEGVYILKLGEVVQ